MDLTVFESMDNTQLKSYLEFLLWHYRVVDAFWFLYVAEKFDQPTAERINEQGLGPGSADGGQRSDQAV